MKARHWIVALMLTFATSAFAMHCPMDMKKIDEALANNPDLSSAGIAQVKKLRAEGESLHKAGKHQQSVETLGKAMQMLGIQ